MKHFILITLATTTLLLFSTTTTTNANTNVLDVYGESLVAGGKYYITPYKFDAVGGGFSWKEIKHAISPCPEFYIYQVEDNLDYGQPAAFYPLKSRNNKITLSTHINIIFPDVSPPESLPFICHPTSNVWKVDDHGKNVLLGGKKGGRHSKSVFSIEELKTGGYGIYYCNDGQSCSSGLVIDPSSNDRRLIVNGTNPIPVVFETEEFFIRKYGRYAV